MLERTNIGQSSRAVTSVVVAEGRFAFVSGQGPRQGGDGKVVPGTIEEQTRLVLENLDRVIGAVGGEKSRIVRCGCFLAELGDFDAFDNVYREFFGSEFPARTTVEARLNPGMKIEIDAIVCLD